MRSDGFSEAKNLTGKICLGTAQFGMNYGIANKSGRPSRGTVFEILDYAHGVGIEMLDTAPEYGDSEHLIGEYIALSKASFKIISKATAVKDNSDIERGCRATLERVGQPHLYAYLLRSAALDKYGEARRCLEELKEKRLIEKMGLSLYKISELERLLESRLPFDAIELPYNIFDQRFCGYFSVLRRMGVEIYTRSVFLQGLFFLGEAEMREDFTWARAAIARLRRMSLEKGVSINALCLGFAMLNNEIDKVIIGVDSLQQIQEDIASLNDIDMARDVYGELRTLGMEDEEVLLPYNWK
jgi:aryl-alcohol dehydrogenase-like predicted oxidoreductase